MITLDSLSPVDLRRAAAELTELALLAEDRGADQLAEAYVTLADQLLRLAGERERPAPPPDVFV